MLDPDVRSPAQPQQRASVALFIDPETLRPVGRVALSPAGDAARELGPPVDWTVLQDGSVLVVTGRGALVRVSETAVEKTFVDGRRSALAVSAQALLAPDGRALYMWLRTESSPARLARVEVRTGAVFASTTLEGAEGIGHGLAPDGSTLYVTARHGGEQGTRVHALDPITLIERGRSDLVREPPSAGLIELVVSTR